ncbi:epoxide hydrolase [Hyphodiscus hymeniophilus]|uniref:Epoxide hydrolase n=1 Tax=Hyphodiscus hymeniophilus TaxID=353542 RepID=A0A9P6VQH8_9HELO|nr:epoxide hydrolase [Hyphodiscus hymeniophilus]
MHSSSIRFLLLAFLGAALVDEAVGGKSFNLKPFTVDLCDSVPRMLKQIQNTALPSSPEYAGVGSSFGIDLGVLKNLQSEWLTDFDWQKEQYSLNQLNHYTAEIEGLTIHFIHERSKDPNAIPLILNHGWPGSFLEFLPVLDQLTQKASTSAGKTVSFDVIIPSLPGFTFSTAPPANWTYSDTARVFNTLMTEVLGYKTYATSGTDLGAAITYAMYDQFNTTARAGHFVFLPFFPLDFAQLAAANISLSPLETIEEENFVQWNTVGNGYFIEHTTKPNTIGLALYDSPIGQLSWIAEKFISWSDPRAGTPPSVLNQNEILLSVSLYYLTRSIVSGMYTYAQNANGFATDYVKAQTDAPMIFSAFKYNIAFWPAEMVEKVGNLKLYSNHDFGGHFPGLDNPTALLKDLREIATYWVD